MKRIITIDGTRWLCDAVSRQAALDEIAMARVTGSVGSQSVICRPGEPPDLIAKVHRINPDYSEVQPS